MTDTATFDSYLEFRFDRAQALTPGKKREMILEMLAEAQQGRVPVSRDKVAHLPTDNRSVQAVLAGEPVSMGESRVQSRSAISGAAAALGRVQTMSRLGQVFWPLSYFSLS